MARHRSEWARIERSREARLWVTQVVLPAVAVGAWVVSKNPELAEVISDKYHNTVDKVKGIFKPKKNEED